MIKKIFWFLLLLGLKNPLSAQGSPIETIGRDTIFPYALLKGDTVECIYRFKNTTKTAYKILQVHPSCQCTAPEYTQDSIYPNQEAYIKLVFYTKKMSVGPFNKYAIVLTPLGERTFYLIGTLYEFDDSKVKHKYKKYKFINDGSR